MRRFVTAASSADSSSSSSSLPPPAELLADQLEWLLEAEFQNDIAEFKENSAPSLASLTGRQHFLLAGRVLEDVAKLGVLERDPQLHDDFVNTLTAEPDDGFLRWQAEAHRQELVARVVSFFRSHARGLASELERLVLEKFTSYLHKHGMFIAQPAFYGSSDGAEAVQIVAEMKHALGAPPLGAAACKRLLTNVHGALMRECVTRRIVGASCVLSVVQDSNTKSAVSSFVQSLVEGNGRCSPAAHELWDTMISLVVADPGVRSLDRLHQARFLNFLRWMCVAWRCEEPWCWAEWRITAVGQRLDEQLATTTAPSLAAPTPTPSSAAAAAPAPQPKFFIPTSLHG